MPPATPAARTAIDKLVAETGSLYSLPAVALEVLRLTENETVDVAALKQAIERDPALVVKLLKVVNSSLFGLGGEVSNLTQALALLGARPLKMLVLGFSLPEGLMAEAPAEQLQRFWRSSLTRALVARDLAAEHFDLPADGPSPDDAFVAGLLQDIGVLVLINRLGEPYSQLLANAAQEGVPPTELERRSLGFTRSELSAALVRQWGLPAALTEAIAAAAGDQPLDDPLEGPATDLNTGLARPLRLADLLVQLVVDRQLDALPVLLERGAAYCGLTGDAVRAMVEPLEARVADLAAAMAAPLGGEEDYRQVLADAQARRKLVTESAVAAAQDSAGPQTDDDAVCEQLLAECHELRVAVSHFLKGKPEAAAKLLRAEGAHTPADPAATAPGDDQPTKISDGERERLLDAVGKLARQTRASRHPLSLAVVAIDGDLEHRATDRHVRATLAAAGETLGERRAARLTLGPRLFAVLLPAIGRAEAMAFVQEVERLLADPPAPDRPIPDAKPPAPIVLHAGVATIESAPNRFDPAKLLDAAEGCLSTARLSTTKPIRSIEVF